MTAYGRKPQQTTPAAQPTKVHAAPPAKPDRDALIRSVIGEVREHIEQTEKLRRMIAHLEQVVNGGK